MDKDIVYSRLVQDLVSHCQEAIYLGLDAVDVRDCLDEVDAELEAFEADREYDSDDV